MSGLPANWAAIVGRWRVREISPEIALAQLVLSGAGEDIPERLAGAGIEELAAFAGVRRANLIQLGALVASGIEPANGSTEATRALFDRLAAEAPDPAVAFYALGDPETLRQATDELVAVITAWAGVEGRRVLDFGCGTGRVSAALRGRTARVLGVDLSPGMIAEARKRHGEDEKFGFRVVDADGPELGRFDLALAVDMMPFVVRAGAEAVASTFARLASVLEPGGDLLIFNWSYRGDVAQDAEDATRHAAANGLQIVRSAERPFALWDGIGFHFRRPA